MNKLKKLFHSGVYYSIQHDSYVIIDIHHWSEKEERVYFQFVGPKTCNKEYVTWPECLGQFSPEYIKCFLAETIYLGEF